MRKSTPPLAVLLAGAAGLAWSLAEARAYTLRRLSVPVLPAGSDPLRVLHLSDLHLVPTQERKIEWVRGLAALEPDLVVNTGDNLAHVDAVPALLRSHGPLLERPGVFVMGSNDYIGPILKNPARYLLRQGPPRTLQGPVLPTDDLVKGFEDAGWLNLNNRRGQLTVGGHDLDLVGVDDPHIRRDRYPDAVGPAAPGALRVGVVHAPYRRVLDALTADGAELILAGHTHGGQLRVPGYGALVTNCDLDRGRARGVSRWPAPGAADEAWMHVCAGLGTNPYTPVRFACRPEATLLTLLPKGS